MVADFGEHTYDENKVCTVCRTQYVSKGLEYTMSANGPHWVVSGIGSCTDTVIYIPAAYNGNHHRGGAFNSVSIANVSMQCFFKKYRGIRRA